MNARTSRAAKAIEKQFAQRARADQDTARPLDMAALDREIERRRAAHAEREARAREIAAQLKGQAKEAAPIADTIKPEQENAFAFVLGNANPRSPEEIRAWELEHEVFPRLEWWGFEKRFRQEITDWRNAEQAATFEVCRRKLTGVGAVIALIGRRGAGKTTIVAQLALDRAWRVQRARETGGPGATATFVYHKVTSLVRTFKPLYANFGSLDTEALKRGLDAVCAHDILAIDEMHDLSELAVREALLIDVIDRRYAACRDTILVSNQTPAEWAEQTPDSIQSRINEHGIVLKCEWESWRDRRDR